MWTNKRTLCQVHSTYLLTVSMCTHASTWLQLGSHFPTKTIMSVS